MGDCKAIPEKIIYFEGIDGCGKTTQINMLKEVLEKKGYKLKLAKQPGYTDLGSKVRDILLNSEEEVPVLVQTLLFAADRADMNLKLLRDLQNGYNVICDRSILSSYTYQASAGRCYIDEINSCGMRVLNSYPSLIIVLDINPKTALDRIDKRGARDAIERELGEKSLGILAYNYKINALDFNHKIIDANRSVSDIHLDIVKAVEEFINE